MPATTEIPSMPRQWVKGLVPTMNDKGFMFEVLDRYAEEFIETAANSDRASLDIGCAYGVATLPALIRGARITACDMDIRHLQVLESRTPPQVRNHLTLVPGILPDIALPENHFGALLCSRVLHFLTGDEIEQSLRNMYRWLCAGGKIFLVADTPYGIWRKFVPDWEMNIAAGSRWPGLIPEPVRYLPFSTSDEDVGPPLMNLMNPDLLQRMAEEAGFMVEHCSYINRADFSGIGHMDGRENCGLVAIKPATQHD